MSALPRGMHVAGKRLCHLFIPFPARTQLRSKSSFNRFDESPRRHHFARLLVLDFEATCDSKRGTIRPQVKNKICHNIVLFYCTKRFDICTLKSYQEIIEFPVLNVETNSFEIVGTFHRYVKPEIHPTLTPFCTSLTGIIQVGLPIRCLLESYLLIDLSLFLFTRC